MSDSVKHDWKSCVLKMYREFESPTKTRQNFIQTSSEQYKKDCMEMDYAKQTVRMRPEKSIDTPLFWGYLWGYKIPC